MFQIETLLSAPEIAEREIETQTKILNESEDVIQKMREIIEQKLPLVQEKTATLQKRIGEVATELSERTVTENDLSSKVCFYLSFNSTKIPNNKFDIYCKLEFILNLSE